MQYRFFLANEVAIAEVRANDVATHQVWAQWKDLRDEMGASDFVYESTTIVGFAYVEGAPEGFAARALKIGTRRVELSSRPGISMPETIPIHVPNPRTNEGRLLMERIRKLHLPGLHTLTKRVTGRHFVEHTVAVPPEHHAEHGHFMTLSMHCTLDEIEEYGAIESVDGEQPATRTIYIIGIPPGLDPLFDLGEEILPGERQRRLDDAKRAATIAARKEIA
jgi:hypothetical protein